MFAQPGPCRRPPSAVAPPLLPVAHRMSWLSRMLGGKSDGGLKPQRLDYLNEALALERQSDLHPALTSYRLAPPAHPNDPRLPHNIPIPFSPPPHPAAPQPT